ncbi:MAG TPA: hypothetical protein VFK52_00780 [Nocardioidaceae bacterium]|nr:hypothetical protein [Nocardioidaceae bacterium]
MKQYRVPVAAALTASAFAALSLVGTADAKNNLPNIPRHAHYIQLQDGSQVWVGPDLCGNPSLQGAFNQFHVNVHVGGANGGLDHEHNPNDIKSAACPS